MLRLKYSLERLFKNERPALYLLVILTFVVKCIFISITFYKSGTSNWNDDRFYMLLGEQIASGNWNPHASGEQFMRVAPWIPLVIAGIIKVFNDPVIPFYIYNVLSACLLVSVLFYLGKELFDQKTGWIIAIWVFFNIEFFKYVPHILKEPTIYLLIPAILLFLHRFKKNNFYSLILSALLFTVLIHTDERYFIYLPVFPLLILFKKQICINGKIKGIIIWVLTVVLLMIPWTIRNYKLYDQVVIISHRTTQFTSKLWGKDLYHMKFFTEDPVKANKNTSSEILEGSNNVIEGSLKKSGKYNLYIKTFINIWRPAYFNSVEVIYSWWDQPRNQVWSMRHNLVSLVFYGIFLPFYLIGLIMLIVKKDPFMVLIGLLPLINSLLHTYLVMPEERYRYPFVFIIVMTAIYAVNRIVLGFQSRKQIL